MRALAKPAGYVAVSAFVAYLVVLGEVFILPSEFVVSVVIAGIVGLLAVVFGSGVLIYTRGRRSCQVMIMSPTSRLDLASSSHTYPA